MKNLTKDSSRFYSAALLSLLIHLPLFTVTPPQKSPLPPPPLEVERITPEQLKRYRNVGIKNGSKRFSVPIPSPPNLQSLRSPEPSPPPPRSPLAPYVLPSSPSPLARRKFRVRPSRPSDASFLRQTDLGVRFDPPEGVSEDELNDAEKTFWSFKKRVYQTYASSILSTYNQMLLSRPQIKRQLKTARNQVIAGKMVFDEKGNVLKIRITRPSPEDDFQTLFEKSLQNINKIPNPPQGLLSSEGKLTLYYELIINGR